jgi:uncharacterized protein
MSKSVLLIGGTGFIGKHFAMILKEKGYEVGVLTRKARINNDGIKYYTWNVENKTVDRNAFLNVDCIINLAGENVAAKRWTEKRKEELLQSRVAPNEFLYDILKNLETKPTTFICASATGIYGSYNGDKLCNEGSSPAKDFLAKVCQSWESSADLMTKLDIRTVKIRTGIVLGKDGGFLKRVTPIFRFGLGSALGSGKQYMPWIHIDDLCNIYLQAIENETLEGVYNATVKDNTTNLIFSKTLARRIFHYPLWMPNIPAFILKLIFGEMAKILLAGRRVLPERIEKAGFKFKYVDLELALKDCFSKK